MSLSLIQGVAIGSSLVSSGAIGVVSAMTVPALLSAPHTIAAKQFKLVYGIGRATQPPTTLLAALLHGLVAYRLHAAGRAPWARWAASAVLTAAVLPWTWALMEPVSHQLLAIAGTEDKREGGTEVAGRTEGLLRRWSGLNVARSLLAASAGAVGLWAVLDGQ